MTFLSPPDIYPDLFSDLSYRLCHLCAFLFFQAETHQFTNQFSHPEYPCFFFCPEKVVAPEIADALVVVFYSLVEDFVKHTAGSGLGKQIVRDHDRDQAEDKYRQNNHKFSYRPGFV